MEDAKKVGSFVNIPSLLGRILSTYNGVRFLTDPMDMREMRSGRELHIFSLLVLSVEQEYL